MSFGTQEKHDWMCKYLLTRPHQMKIPSKIVARTMEYDILDGNNIMAAPDLWFLQEHSKKQFKHWFIEVKSGNSQKSFSWGMRQLERYLKYGQNTLDVYPRTLLVLPPRKHHGPLSQQMEHLELYSLGDSFDKYNR